MTIYFLNTKILQVIVTCYTNTIDNVPQQQLTMAVVLFMRKLYKDVYCICIFVNSTIKN